MSDIGRLNPKWESKCNNPVPNLNFKIILQVNVPIIFMDLL